MESKSLWALPVCALIIVVFIIGNSFGWWSISNNQVINNVIDRTNETLVVDVKDDGIESTVTTNPSLFGAKYDTSLPDLKISTSTTRANNGGAQAFLTINEDVDGDYGGSLFTYSIYNYEWIDPATKPNLSLIYTANNITEKALLLGYVSTNSGVKFIDKYTNTVVMRYPHTVKELWWTKENWKTDFQSSVAYINQYSNFCFCVDNQWYYLSWKDSAVAGLGNIVKGLMLSDYYDGVFDTMKVFKVLASDFLNVYKITNLDTFELEEYKCNLFLSCAFSKKSGSIKSNFDVSQLVDF